MDSIDSMRISEIVEGRVNVRTLSSGRKAIVLRNGDEIRAYSETCPHMGADLSEARFCARARTLQCKWHGYLFSSQDGRFLENPNVSALAKLRQQSPHFNPNQVPRFRLLPVRCVVAGNQVHFSATEPTPPENAVPEGAQE